MKQNVRRKHNIGFGHSNMSSSSSSIYVVLTSHLFRTVHSGRCRCFANEEIRYHTTASADLEKPFQFFFVVVVVVADCVGCICLVIMINKSECDKANNQLFIVHLNRFISILNACCRFLCGYNPSHYAIPLQATPPPHSRLNPQRCFPTKLNRPKQKRNLHPVRNFVCAVCVLSEGDYYYFSHICTKHSAYCVDRLLIHLYLNHIL